MYMIKLNYIFFVILLTGQNSNTQNMTNKFKWPDNHKAAVCLTFDDGLDCHLDSAVPLLDSFQIKGTFYCTGNSPSLQNRPDEWRNIVRTGHELGNHSLFHPCDGRIHEWVLPEFDLTTYSGQRIRSELFIANTLLKALDGKTKRTYAYTCSNFKINGDTSYVDIVRDLFVAARCDGLIPGNMSKVDLHFMPSWCVDDENGRELINYVKKARDNGTIATFMFHSVGGGYLNVSMEALTQLLTYLKSNEQHYWVDTFFNVTQYISAIRKIEQKKKFIRHE